MYAWHFLPISFYFYCWLLFMRCLVCNEIIQTETLSIQMTNCKYAFISSNMLFYLNFETTKCPTVLAFIHQLHSILETFFTIHLLDKNNGNQRNREYFKKKEGTLKAIIWNDIKYQFVFWYRECEIEELRCKHRINNPHAV